MINIITITLVRKDNCSPLRRWHATTDSFPQANGWAELPEDASYNLIQAIRTLEKMQELPT